ncbi:hypothetical protein OG900_12910 [Streptomyces sp. NBC_00433]
MTALDSVANFVGGSKDLRLCVGGADGFDDAEEPDALGSAPDFGEPEWQALTKAKETATAVRPAASRRVDLPRDLIQTLPVFWLTLRMGRRRGISGTGRATAPPGIIKLRSAKER